MPLDDVKLLKERGSINMENLKPLLDAWVEHHVPPRDEVADSIKNVREQVSEQMSWLDQIKAAVTQFRDRLRGHSLPETLRREPEGRDSRKEGMQRYIQNEIGNALQNGDLIVAQKEGRPIGMVRLTRLNPTPFFDLVPEGTEIYELGSAFVLPEARREGVYRELRTQMLQHCAEQHPNAALICSTKTESVKKMCRQDEWAEIPYADFLRALGREEDAVQRISSDPQSEGVVGFLRQPS